jgi:hypothetical protein
MDKRSNKTITSSVKDWGLYNLLDDVAESQDLAASIGSNNSGSLSHQRYGHLKFQYRSSMTKCKTVHGLPNIQDKMTTKYINGTAENNDLHTNQEYQNVSYISKKK